MGSSESKMTVASTPKPEPVKAVQNRRLAELADPRSPSCGIARTPIQVGGGAAAAPCVSEVQESVGPMCFDPRSPTPGVARTPLKDSVKVTVSSLARKLSTFFLSDIEVADSDSALLPHVSFTKQPSLPSIEQQDELSSTEPLLPPHSSPSDHTAISSSPVACSPSVGYGSFCNSPFVLVGEAQVEVDADEEVSLEEAEEALLLGESPLRRELSLSLLACRDGVYSPEFYSSAEERPATPLPPSDEKEHSDHPYALPQFSSEPVQPCQEAVPALELEISVDTRRNTTEAPAVSEDIPIQAEQPKMANPEPARSSNKPSPTLNLQREGGILIPRFDPRSPSQAVFKPQWLGVGFGATGVRARAVQGRGKGTSSPLSTRKPSIDENENKVVFSKQKQRGKALLGEGRSPLQILKDANSPRDHPAQMKLKVSTPEKQRFGQMDRRVLALSLNKENQ